MDKYENEGVAGEGSYGVVLKCRHRDTGRQAILHSINIFIRETNFFSTGWWPSRSSLRRTRTPR